MFWLKQQLKKMRKKASPRPEFKAQLWTKLSYAYEAEYHEPIRHHRPLLRFSTIGVSLIILFVASGTGVYAYESPEVIEGHPLQPLKERIEQTKGAFARTPEQKAAHKAKMLQRRLKEAAYHSENKEKFEKVLNKAAKNLDITPEELKEQLRNPENRKEMLNKLLEKDERYQKVIDRVKENRREKTRQNMLKYNSSKNNNGAVNRAPTQAYDKYN